MTRIINTRNVQEVPTELRAILCKPGSYDEPLTDNNYLTRDELVSCIVKYYNLRRPASAPKLIKALPELLRVLGTEAYKYRKTATLMDLEVLIDALYLEEKISIPDTISRKIALASGYTKHTMIVEAVEIAEKNYKLGNVDEDWGSAWYSEFSNNPRL